MNGLARSRRASRPIRVMLAGQLGGEIDGAWWPHTASVATELPELVGVLHRPLGEIIDIRINWAVTEGQLDLETIATGARLMRAGEHYRRPRLMVVVGKAGSAKLLVVPSMTSQALGLMVLRTAARLPTSGGTGDARLFETARVVMRLAEAESLKWCEAINS
ncbi:MAG: hypothetical protein K0U70_10860 [Actinomycetia bacterium]|nr:hypothetical protein [Actinomycetes bacterium]MCH9768285.1 hypothetical protein [Actinomycetes bacterium]